MRKRRPSPRLDSPQAQALASGSQGHLSDQIDAVSGAATAQATLDIQVLPASDNSPVPGSRVSFKKAHSRSAMVVEKLGFLQSPKLVTDAFQ